METERESLILEIKKLSNDLVDFYKNRFNFRNHCYLRIAYDSAVENKWDKVVNKPFVKYANLEQLACVRDFLQDYFVNHNKLIANNINSLSIRNQNKSANKISENMLF